MGLFCLYFFCILNCLDKKLFCKIEVLKFVFKIFIYWIKFFLKLKYFKILYMNDYDIELKVFLKLMRIRRFGILFFLVYDIILYINWVFFFIYLFFKKLDCVLDII